MERERDIRGERERRGEERREREKKKERRGEEREERQGETERRRGERYAADRPRGRLVSTMVNNHIQPTPAGSRTRQVEFAR